MDSAPVISPVGEQTPPGRRPWVSIARRDRHRVWTFLALGAVAIAGGMAVFGLPPVDLKSPLHDLGWRSFTCGGTRAARYTAQGDFAMAWKYNPLGMAVVLAGAFFTVRAAAGVVLGRWLTFHVPWTPRRVKIAIGVGIVLLIALQLRQMGRAELLALAL